MSLNSLYKDRPERIASSIGTQLNQRYILHNAKLGMHVTQDFGVFIQVHNLEISNTKIYLEQECLEDGLKQVLSGVFRIHFQLQLLPFGAVNVLNYKKRLNFEV